MTDTTKPFFQATDFDYCDIPFKKIRDAVVNKANAKVQPLETALAILKKQLVIAELECERLGKELLTQMQIADGACKDVSRVNSQNQSLRRELEKAKYALSEGDHYSRHDALASIESALKQSGERAIGGIEVRADYTMPKGQVELRSSVDKVRITGIED